MIMVVEKSKREKDYDNQQMDDSGNGPKNDGNALPG
jgi:hypothetical protein